MRYTALAAAALLVIEGVAIACVCAGPLTAAEQREAAKRIAAEAVAVAEVELTQPLNHQRMEAELYRVHQVHVGTAPEQFRLERSFTRGPNGKVIMTMTSCDVVLPEGKRTTVVLYPSGVAGSYRIGGTCDHMFINSPGAVALVREEKRRIGGERG